MDDKPVIYFENVNFSYDGVPVLLEVNFSVRERELVYIVGPNGGGKTTLLKLIAGLLKPDTGVIRIFNDTSERSRRRIGYAPQQMHFDPLFPISVLDVVLMGRLGGRAGGRFSEIDRKAALEAMEKLEISDLAHQQFAELSGGQRQRALIARSIASGPELLLLDEPTSNVDPHTEDRLWNLINELNQRLTILLVSHELSFVSRGIKNVLCVNRYVRLHPTSDISGDAVRSLYEKDLRLIRHDLSLSGGD